MPKFRDLTKQTFNRWTIIEHAGKTKWGASLWLCRCSCGNKHIVNGANIVNGQSKSCGCLNIERSRNASCTHDKSRTPEYRIWANMIHRCINPNSQSFENYGKRGIEVCDTWINSFTNFIEDMGKRPSDKYSIDRIDNNGNYSPDNCKWSTKKEQCNNRRNNNIINLDDKKQTLAQWAVELNIHESTIRRRLRSGWPINKVLNQPVNKRK